MATVLDPSGVPHHPTRRITDSFDHAIKMALWLPNSVGRLIPHHLIDKYVRRDQRVLYTADCVCYVELVASPCSALIVSESSMRIARSLRTMRMCSSL